MRHGDWRPNCWRPGPRKVSHLPAYRTNDPLNRVRNAALAPAPRFHPDSNTYERQVHCTAQSSTIGHSPNNHSPVGVSPCPARHPGPHEQLPFATIGTEVRPHGARLGRCGRKHLAQRDPGVCFEHQPASPRQEARLGHCTGSSRTPAAAQTGKDIIPVLESPKIGTILTSIFC